MWNNKLSIDKTPLSITKAAKQNIKGKNLCRKECYFNNLTYNRKKIVHLVCDVELLAIYEKFVLNDNIIVHAFLLHNKDGIYFETQK